MISAKNGKIDLNQLEVADIIDINVLKSFLDNFALGMNCAAVSVDRNGNEITAPSYYRDFCSNYVHKSPIGDARCAQCHNQMGELAVKSGGTYVGGCHAGLIDFAAPIIVDGVHLGTILGGQILDRPPDEDKIRKVAQDIQVGSDDLWTAAKKIDIVERKNIQAAAEVLNIVVNAMAKSGYQKLQIELLSSELAAGFIQISATVDILAESAQRITDNQHILTDNIVEVESVTRDISGILKSITKIADTIKLIGFNASIEAARIGQAGRGINVVAVEIQRLSNDSKETATAIDDKNQSITQKIDKTLKRAAETLTTTAEQSASMEELASTVQTLVDIAKQLQSLV